ncbi:MAG: DUF4347 domain-containing protein [Pseudomonadota bacterium]
MFALRQAVLEEIEPRILFSADDPASLLAATLQSPDAATEQHASVAPAPQQVSAPHELVFIDARAPDADALFANIGAQAAAGRPIEAFLLQADEDGIARIGAVLAGRDAVTAIHLLGHGNDAAMRLGANWLDADTLLGRAGDIAAWGSHLDADADLLLYGCSFAAEPAGRALVADLAQLTGADVAASTDATGATALGGDWVLEAATGTIESAVALDATGQAGYAALLNAYIVTSTADSGAGSLRQAILDANANAGTDTIHFAIAGTGVHTISLASALPTLTGTVVIDGSTDDSFAANGGKPAIVLEGNALNVDGLQLTATADGSSIRGLVIRNFGGATIKIDAGSDGNTIAGNYLGALDAGGSFAAAINGSYTMYVAGANNVIGGFTAADRNVMATGGGGVYGLLVSDASATGNRILGNYIGIGADGSTALSATQAGIAVLDATSTRIEGNVIAASGDDAVYLSTAGAGTVIHNNLIGVDAGGTARVGASNHGIWLDAAGAGTVITDNVIAGASESGIRLDAGVNGTTVQGNRIGTDLAGTANWGVQQDGILIASSNNSIGGSGAGEGNIVAYSNQAATSHDGIAVSSGTGNALLGNSVYGTVAGGGALGIDLGPNGAAANDAGDADSGANNAQNTPVLVSATIVGGQITITGTLDSLAGTPFRIEFFATPSGSDQGRTYLGFTHVTTSGNAASFGTTLTAAVTPGSTITATATRATAGFAAFTDTSEFSAAIVASDHQIAVTTVADNNDAGIAAGNATHTLTWLAANRGADGQISLREAIIAANNTANGAGPDRITFAIAGTGVHTLVPLTSLPTISAAVILDASTDDSVAANGGRPAIVLDGNDLAGHGLTLSATADGSTIRGFVIRDFDAHGIHFDAGSDNHTLAGNYVGRLDATGTAAGAGEGNGGSGIYIGGANNLVGGSSAADRNVISGNEGVGVRVDGAAATGNQIAGNFIGLTAAGTAVLGNGDDGVQLFGGAAGNTVGGASADWRNVISGNADAIQIGHTTGGSSGNVVRHNYLGTDVTGQIDLGNGSDGVDLWYSSADNQILDNLVSGNDGHGLYIGNAVGSNTGTVIRGNLIGVAADGSSALGNGRDGINIGDGAGADGTIVGGTLAGQGNTVAHNANGIRVVTGNGVALLGNIVYANTALGIDLGASGVTPNDPGDADSGANHLQNTPVLSLVKTDGSGQIDIRGVLDSLAGSHFRIEFFATPADGSGMVALGFANVATDGAGHASFATVLAAAVPVGHTVTATATRCDAAYAGFTDTSEYALALDAGTTPVNTAPATRTVTEDVSGALTGLSVVDGGVLTMTTGLSVLHGTLTVSLAGGASIDAGANGSAALTLRGTAAQVNAALATLSYLGLGDHAGSDTLTMLSTDESTLSDSDTVAITVTAVNDAPVLVAAAPTLASLTEDQTANAGQTVASIVGTAVSDVDDGAVEGIALTAVVSGTGGWAYSLDAGSNWAAVGPVNGTSALLLRATDLLRFVPDGENATIGSITYQAWDQSGGSAGSLADASVAGGTSAFSTASDTASIAVAAVNDAPVLGAIAPMLTSITENQTTNGGQTISTLIGISISDVDAGASQGIAIFAADAGNGTWQFSIDSGTSWAALGAVSDSTALLLRATDSIRFLPNGANGTAGSIDYRAWDQTSGSAGSLADASVAGGASAFSTASDTASITVAAVNDAPVLSAVAPTLTSITEDQMTNGGQTIASFIGASMSDVDAGAAQGIAIFAADAGNGTWQFSIDGGTSWAALGTVSDAAALLLRATDSIRFVPDGANGTAGSISYRAWDGTSGLAGTLTDASVAGGTSAFSTVSDTASITVAAVNDAPALGAIAPTLASITEDQTANGGQSVASFIGTSITDADAGAVQGIAIFAADAGNGTWQFSTDGGTTWAALGAVTDSTALLLRASDSIRFVPDGANSTAGSIDYRAWDQTSGLAGTLADASVAGGATAFSAASDTASISVASVNDAPVLAASAPMLTSITEDQTTNAGQTVASFVGASITDVDAGAVQGIAIFAADAGNGTWQFSIDGGASWATLGVVSDSTALLLRATDSIRFLPNGANGTAGSIDYRAWDQTSGSAGSLADASVAGGATAFSAASETASIIVTALNDAPVLTAIAPTLTSITEDQTTNGGQTIATFIGTSISDVDVGASQGIAIFAADAGNDTWQFSIDGGTSWAALGAVSDSTALLLRATDAIRFVPDAANGTAGSISYRAWDQTSGLAGDRADTSAVGGSSGFGADTDIATIQVADLADAPVIAAGPSSFDVAENTTGVATFVATDIDVPGQALTWSIAGGADAGRFSIDAVTGALRFLVAPDAEAPTAAGGGQVHHLVVRVDDGTLADTRALAVTVTPVNDNAPVFTSHGGGAEVHIDMTGGTTAVAPLQAVDADLPAPDLRYAIVGGADAGRFTLDAATGALAFVAAPEARVYDVLVEASDGTLMAVQRLSIAVAAPVSPETPPVAPPAAPPVAPPVAPPAPAPAPSPAPAAPSPAPIPPPTAAPDVAPAAPEAHDATAHVPAIADPSPGASAPAPAEVAPPAAASIAEPPAPRPSPGMPIEASPARVIAIGMTRPAEPVARAAAAIVLPSHRVALDITMLALNPLAIGPQAARSDSPARYSAEPGAGGDDLPADEDPFQTTASVTIALALSIGVIGWASRGAALMASVLVASPAWGGYDLLPVLRRRTEDADWGDDDAPDDAPLADTDLTPLDAAAGTTRRDHDILELH